MEKAYTKKPVETYGYSVGHIEEFATGWKASLFLNGNIVAYIRYEDCVTNVNFIDANDMTLLEDTVKYSGAVVDNDLGTAVAQFLDGLYAITVAQCVALS